jgi:peptidyl-tRNA hydrolase, PTH1 family
MKLIIGLGNPGFRYAGTRHNIGFAVVKSLAKSCKIGLKNDRNTCALSGKGLVADEPAILAMPLTYMNLSGNAVGALVKKYKIDLADLLVICDDVDLEFGRLKIKSGGSSAGHKGVASVKNSLASDGFSRLRIGIGRSDERQETADYVLSSFNRSQRLRLKEIIGQAVSCVEVWAVKGITESMNMFNVKK